MNRFTNQVLVSLVLVFSLPTAWAIQPDIHYGDAGIVQTNISSFIPPGQAAVGSQDVGVALVVQADGKVITGGWASYGYNGLSSPTDMALTRHHIDGSLDAGFATDGRYTHSIASPLSRAVDLILQADGAIVSLASTNDGTVIVRHSSNGSIDTGFGVDGVVSSGGGAIIQQADGKLVVAGGTIRRFDTFGVADEGFGVGGEVSTSVGCCDRYSIVEQSDNKLVIVGLLGLERFTSTGDLDTSFGTNGQVLFSEQVVLPKIVQQEDGNLIVAFVRGERNTLFLKRYSADGIPDPSFGVAGTVSSLINDNGGNYNYSLMIQEDDKLVAYMREGTGNLLLMRYNTDGSPDDSFDGDGVYELPFDSGSGYLLGDMVYQSGAFYVLATSQYDFYMAKFVEPEAPPVAGTVVTTNVSSTDFGESVYSFTIDYSDVNGNLDFSTINAADITVCDGVYCASVDSASWSGSAFNGTATYNLTPPGGSWDTDDIGIYTVAIAADEIADDLSTYVAASANAGKFGVSLDAPPPPLAGAVVAADVGQAELDGSTYLLTIGYSDANGDLDFSSIDAADITVCSGERCASVANATWAGDTSSGVATYILKPPGGSWDVLDSGTYTIAITTNEVADTLSGFVAADASAGSFSVSIAVPTIPDPPIIGVARPADGAAWLEFAPPANNGGTPIIDYTTSCGTGRETTGVTSPLIAGWMTNGTTYYCSVTARNSVGSSAASSTIAVTPTAYLSALTGTCTGTVAAGNHSLWGCSVPAGETLTFAPGALLLASGSPINVSGTVTANSAFFSGTNFIVQSGGVLNLNGVTYTGSIYSISFLEGSSGSIINSNITMSSSNSIPYLIEITGASPTISGNTINVDRAVLVSGDGANPTIEANNISFYKNGITFSDAASSGSVNNNTFNFLDTSYPTAIHVNGDASPSISNNIINDHNQRPNRGIRLDINAASSVQVTNNTICATNSDVPLQVDPDYFATGSTALINGNIINCGGGVGISLGGTTSGDGVFAAIQGQSELHFSGILTISAGNTFTFDGGKLKGGTGNNTILARGTFTASNSSIENTSINTFAGGTANLNQMTLTGSAYKIRFREGSSGSITNSQISATALETISLDNAAPVISGNTFSGMPGGIIATNATPTPLVLNIQSNVFKDVVTGITLSGNIDVAINDNQFNRNVSAISISGDAITPLFSNNEFIANDRSLSFMDDAALFAASSSFMATNYFLSAIAAYNSIGMPPAITQSGIVPLIGASLYYEVASTITVQNTIELTVPPGVSLGFAANVGLTVEVGGNLIAGIDGSLDPVSFQGVPGSPAGWSGMSVAGEASFKACNIQAAATGLTVTDATVQVSDCSIRSNQIGILVSGASSSVTVTNSLFQDNYVNGAKRLSGDLTISQSTFFRNGEEAIYSADSAPYVMAQDNDWSHISGPLDNSDDTGSGGLYNPGGLGESVSDFVDYDPWLNKPGPTFPDAPTIGTASPGDTIAWIAFSAPLNDGGSSILDYTVSCDAGTGSTGTTSPLLVTGLSNDTTYQCHVTARNDQGNSSASGSVAVTPYGGDEVTLPPSEGGSGEVVTFDHVATPPGGGAPVPVTLAVNATQAAPPEPPPEANSLVAPIDIRSTSSVIGYLLVLTFTIPESSINVFSGYWKYGKETLGGLPHWYDFGTVADNGDGTGYELSEDGKTLTVYLIDGLRGDDDLLANAVIVDPALPIIQLDPVIFKDGFD